MKDLVPRTAGLMAFDAKTCARPMVLHQRHVFLIAYYRQVTASQITGRCDWYYGGTSLVLQCIATSNDTYILLPPPYIRAALR